LNRRNFVAGLASVYSLVTLRGGPAFSEHQTALENAFIEIYVRHVEVRHFTRTQG